jgi:methyltransferase (TIGR00027 family)
MEVREGSRTALMVAAYRGRASATPDALIDDPWAARLAGPAGEEIATKVAAINPHMELWIALRTAFIDRQVGSRVEGGITQVVLLGAGLDTRAARLATDGVRFFEVDHPHSQEDKRARLAALDGYPTDAATYASCDFERDDFVERLVAAGFDSGAPAFFVWEGVTMYLSEEAVAATLARISGCHPESVVLFDYVNKNVAQGSRLREADAATRKMIEDLGEPMVWGVNDTTPILHRAGFRHLRTVSFDQICLALTGSWERARLFRFQGIALASVAREVTT